MDTLTGLLDDLQAVVTGAKPAQATMDDTLRTAAVLDAARRSLTDGVPVATHSVTDGGPA